MAILEIVKIAICEDDILPYLQKYSNKFISVPLGLTDVRKYGLIENNTMLMISQSKSILHKCDAIYNIMLTLMNMAKVESQFDLQSFEQSMPFTLLPASQALVDLLSSINKTMGL